MTTDEYNLHYKSFDTGEITRFKKVRDGRYESEHGKILTISKLAYHYLFVKNTRRKSQVWVTTVNGFKVRLRGHEQQDNT